MLRFAFSFTVLISLCLASRAETVRECAACHNAQSKLQPDTAMAHALSSASDSPILKNHGSLRFTSGVYHYSIERRGSKSIYTVTDGAATIQTPMLWAFGNGSMGQTYVYEWHGDLYQSRVSFYRETQGLDFTLGALSTKPRNLGEAAGLKMSRDERQQCFGCHATGVSEVSEQHLVPGVQCERCHGSSEQHVASFRPHASASPVRMKSLRGMSADDTGNFCGQCHRTWADIASSPGFGVGNVRFQPYRLTNSKCFDVDDRRIACTACHDPHQPLQHVSAKEDIAFYDARCNACHGGGKAEAAVCKVASANCSSCHMPKIELPGSHHRFTDHQIRIARADGKFPE